MTEEFYQKLKEYERLHPDQLFVGPLIEFDEEKWLDSLQAEADKWGGPPIKVRELRGEAWNEFANEWARRKVGMTQAECDEADSWISRLPSQEDFERFVKN